MKSVEKAMLGIGAAIVVLLSVLIVVVSQGQPVEPEGKTSEEYSQEGWKRVADTAREIRQKNREIERSKTW